MTTLRYHNTGGALGGGSAQHSVLYAEFKTGNLDLGAVDFDDGPNDFVEVYDAHADPWMMDNLRDAQTPPHWIDLDELHAAAMAWYTCAGSSCP